MSVSGEEMQNKLEDLSDCHYKATDIYDSQNLIGCPWLQPLKEWVLDTSVCSV